MSLTDKKEVTASLTCHIIDKFKVTANCSTTTALRASAVSDIDSLDKLTANVSSTVQDNIGINARVTTDTLIAEEVYRHTQTKDNPHSVTAKQIGAKEKTFIYRQLAPSKEWEIEHNLFQFPSVSIVDSAGSVVIGDIIYVSDSKILVKFTAAFAGKAYLN